MRLRLFLDTSALAKLFVPEAGTAELKALFEFHSLVWRRCREGSLDIARATSLLTKLDLQLGARPLGCGIH